MRESTITCKNWSQV